MISTWSEASHSCHESREPVIHGAVRPLHCEPLSALWLTNLVLMTGYLTFTLQHHIFLRYLCFPAPKAFLTLATILNYPTAHNGWVIIGDYNSALYLRSQAQVLSSSMYNVQHSVNKYWGNALTFNDKERSCQSQVNWQVTMSGWAQSLSFTLNVGAANNV